MKLLTLTGDFSSHSKVIDDNTIPSRKDQSQIMLNIWINT